MSKDLLNKELQFVLQLLRSSTLVIAASQYFYKSRLVNFFLEFFWGSFTRKMFVVACDDSIFERRDVVAICKQQIIVLFSCSRST